MLAIHSVNNINYKYDEVVFKIIPARELIDVLCNFCFRSVIVNPVLLINSILLSMLNKLNINMLYNNSSKFPVGIKNFQVTVQQKINFFK